MSVGFGAFGKMPALGDFFQLNVPQGFVRVWDNWLQRAMMQAGEAGGAAWDDQYMSAPIWRFSLPAGVAGPGKVLGVLMPSVDRVGRRFPLSLVAAVDRDGPAAFDHLEQTATFERLEDLALSALDDDMSRDRLAAALQDIAAPVPQRYAPLRRAGNTLVMTQANPTNPAVEAAAGLISGQGFSHPSLWTTVLNETSRMMVCDGLPDATQACALFDLTAPLWTDARPIA